MDWRTKILNELREIEKIDPERYEKIRQEIISMYN